MQIIVVLFSKGAILSDYIRTISSLSVQICLYHRHSQLTTHNSQPSLHLTQFLPACCITGTTHFLPHLPVFGSSCCRKLYYITAHCSINVVNSVHQHSPVVFTWLFK